MNGVIVETFVQSKGAEGKLHDETSSCETLTNVGIVIISLIPSNDYR